MTQGNIWKLLITFSIPLIIGNLLQQMYNTADSIIVGNFVGSNGLAAVGSGTALINLIIAFAQGASVGAGVVVSQYIGADKKDKIKISVHTSICISIILGLILSLLGIFASPSLLIMMKTPKVVLKSSITSKTSLNRFLKVLTQNKLSSCRLMRSVYCLQYLS